MKKLFRKDDEGVSPVIAVILMVAITVVLAGVLYVWVSQFSTGGGGGSVKIGTGISEKTTAYQITIDSISGGTLNLEDVKFQISNENDILQYDLTISDVNPAAYDDGQSKIYAMTHGTTAVTDGSGGALGAGDDIKNLVNCTITYIDQNDDGKISSGDSIWIYKDNSDAGTENIESKYTFKMVEGTEAVHIKEL